MDKKNDTWSSYDFLRSLGIALSIVSIGIAIAVVGYILTTSKGKENKVSSSVSPTPKEAIKK